MPSTISPNMNLVLPTVGQEPGPNWATDLNGDLSAIDSHNHSPGQGVLVQPNGLDINADLTFQNNNGTNFRAVRFTMQPSVITPVNPDVVELYSVLGELYYNDNAGNAVQITSGGSVVGANGNITGLIPPASATYTAFNFTFTWQSNVGIPAIMDMGTIIIRDMSAPYNGITLEAFSPLASPYTLILPSALPLQQSFMTLDPAGHIAAPWTVDNNTIKIVANQLVVQTSALGVFTAHQFEANGKYKIGTFIDGLMFFKTNSTIVNIWIYNLTAGTSGTTEFDLLLASPGGGYASIFSTTGKITSAAASDIWTDSGSAVGVQPGVTKPVLLTTAVTAGQAIRFDILQTMAGAKDCGIIVEYIAG